MNEFLRELERKLFKRMSQDAEIPPDVRELVDCLIKAGCPANAVLSGMIDYTERQNLKELLKDTKIELED